MRARVARLALSVAAIVGLMAGCPRGGIKERVAEPAEVEIDSPDAGVTQEPPPTDSASGSASGSL